MVKASRDNHVHIIEPDKCVHAKFVTLREFMLLLDLYLPIGLSIYSLTLFCSSGLRSTAASMLLDKANAPESDLAIHGTTDQIAELRDR